MAKKVSIEDYNRKKTIKKNSLIIIIIILFLGITAIGSIYLYMKTKQEKNEYRKCMDEAIEVLNKAHVEYYVNEGGFKGYPPADVEETNSKITKVIVNLDKCKKGK